MCRVSYALIWRDFFEQRQKSQLVIETPVQLVKRLEKVDDLQEIAFMERIPIARLPGLCSSQLAVASWLYHHTFLCTQSSVFWLGPECQQHHSPNLQADLWKHFSRIKWDFLRIIRMPPMPPYLLCLSFLSVESDRNSYATRKFSFERN